MREAISSQGARKLNFSSDGLMAAKSDIFSVGLLILEMATLRVEDSWYDYKSGKMNFEIICRKLSYVKARYSSDFYSAIREMLLKDSQIRPDPVKLLKLVYSLSLGKDKSRLDLKRITFPEYLTR